MGIKKYAALILTVMLVFVLCTDVYAETAKDIYELYGIEYTDCIPDSVLDVIQRYDNAKRYVTMYQYIVNSSYNSMELKTRIDVESKRLSKLESNLLGGFNKSIDEIYALEDDYLSTRKDLETNELYAAFETANIETPDVKHIPTESEYMEALRTKDEIIGTSNVGKISAVPVPVLYADNMHTFKKSLYIQVLNSSDVVSVFNGAIVSVKNNCITIAHSGNIYSYYGNLDEVYVSVGDVVFQNQPIGYTNDSIVFKFKINGSIVDPELLFEGNEVSEKV